MLDKLKIFITGATGHLGSTLLKQLNKLDITPYILVLPSDNAYSIVNCNYHKITGNIINKEQMFEIIKQMDVVIHLASLISIKAKDDYLKLYEVNVVGTKNVADACLHFNKKLIYASSVHSIPIKLNNLAMKEPDSFNIDSSHGNYEKTKSIATDYVYNLSHYKKLKATIIYPSGIIGENDYHLGELSTLFIDIANNKLPAYVRGGYAFVDVYDVANMIIKIIKLEKYRTEYIISGQYLSIKNIILTINKHLNRNKLPVKLSINFVKIFIPLFSLIAKIKNKKPLFTLYSLKTIIANSNFDTTKAKNELDFNPKDVRISIIATIEYLLINKPYVFNKKTINKLKAKMIQ